MSTSSNISPKWSIYLRGTSPGSCHASNRVPNIPAEERDRRPGPQPGLQHSRADSLSVQNAESCNLALHSPTASREVSPAVFLRRESPGRAEQPSVPRECKTSRSDRPQWTGCSSNRVLCPLQTFHELFREGLGTQTQQVVIIELIFIFFDLLIREPLEILTEYLNR